MKKRFLVLLSFVMCFLALVGCVDKKQSIIDSSVNTEQSNGSTDSSVDNSTNSSTASSTDSSVDNPANWNDNVADENVVISMFLKNAQHEQDGNYRFRKNINLNNVSFFYCFVYNPTLKLYNCNVLVSTYTYIKLYDYASITFFGGILKMVYTMHTTN